MSEESTAQADDSTQEQGQPRLHDETYRKLFEHPVLLQELVQYFVGEELGVLADELDFEQMRPSKEAFITDSLSRFESDMMCEVPFRAAAEDGAPREPLYVCVLVEFQSKVDWSMPLRVLNYIVLFYLHLATVQPQKLRERALPPVLPIVLYNGKQRWNAPLSVEELIAASPQSPLSAHTPKLSLKLVDASHIDHATLEACHESILATLFAMEQHKEPQGFTTLLTQLDALLKGRGLDRLQETLVLWISELLKPLRLTLSPEQARSIKEIYTMIEGRYDAWEKEVARKAAQEATQEATREATHRTRCEILQEQLNEKFGELPDTLLTAMRSLELDALRLAARRIVHANTVDEVFEDLL